ncbi:unnamed protein product [marine sediment metagenome]|uniref:Uncharacterized protein n=1 Tax=marine sediment metagenome TaxID=412755 RepID=X1T4R2_9ZZZZ
MGVVRPEVLSPKLRGVSIIMPNMTVYQTIQHLETLTESGHEIDLTPDEFYAIRLAISVFKTLPPDQVQLIDAIMAYTVDLGGVNYGTV